ncbi:MAG: oligosaccharide flippase family protein [Sulfuricurvum sp.]|nr:oligosaccharide flippase family protein [Sulfuricurvum sp.]
MIDKIRKHISGDSLKARFLRGSAWLSVGNIAEKILAFASKIILARLLMPEDLGVVVLIASITGLFECMTEVGVKQCVIQNKEGETPDFLNMAWWFSATRGIVLFILAWILTPFVCNFYFEGKVQVLASYDMPTLYSMVRVAFLSMFFHGLISPSTYLMEKQFRFSRVVGYMQSAGLIGIILTIILSFILQNAWAMVIGFVCQGFLRMVMSYIFCPFLPSFHYHRESMAQLFKFGRGMWGSPFFAYIAYNIDILVGGKILGPELMGLYGFAVGLAYIPRELFARIINPVLMPAFTERQDKPEQLQKIISRFAGSLILIFLPIIVISFLFKQEIVTTIYGTNFAPVASIFAIFTINALLIMLSMIFVNLFMAIGRPEVNRNFTFIRALIMTCLMLPVAKIFSIMGMAILQVIANFMLVAFLYNYARKMLHLSIKDMNPFTHWFNKRVAK